MNRLIIAVELHNDMDNWTIDDGSFKLINNLYDPFTIDAGADVQRYSAKKVFIRISENPHEHTCARASFLILLQA